MNKENTKYFFCSGFKFRNRLRRYNKSEAKDAKVSIVSKTN